METAQNQHRSAATSIDGMTLRPVGTIRNTNKDPFLVAKADGIAMRSSLDAIMEEVRQTRRTISDIVISDEFAQLLDGIEDYSHVIVIYWGHKVPDDSRSLIRVHPMGREDYAEVGLFCTCSPARPNPVLVSVVKLHARKGSRLEVVGLDAIDGSPVLDIKPYVKEMFPHEDTQVPDWMSRLMKEVSELDG